MIWGQLRGTFKIYQIGSCSIFVVLSPARTAIFQTALDCITMSGLRAAWGYAWFLELADFVAF
jgi:hypothetical protein